MARKILAPLAACVLVVCAAAALAGDADEATLEILGSTIQANRKALIAVNLGLTDDEARGLRCRECGGWGRPHVLWFDEYYDEEYYRFESSIEAASQADLLLVVGTSGATSLPMQIGQIVAYRGAAIVDVNPDDNPFAEAAAALDRGFAVRGTAVERLPEIVEALR